MRHMGKLTSLNTKFKLLTMVQNYSYRAECWLAYFILAPAIPPVPGGLDVQV